MTWDGTLLPPRNTNTHTTRPIEFLILFQSPIILAYFIRAAESFFSIATGQLYIALGLGPKNQLTSANSGIDGVPNTDLGKTKYYLRPGAGTSPLALDILADLLMVATFGFQKLEEVYRKTNKPRSEKSRLFSP